MIKDNIEFLRIIYRFFADGTKTTYVAIGVGLVIAVLYFRVFFRDRSGFATDVSNAAKNPYTDRSFDYVDARWSRGKIWIWILLSIGCGILAYHQLPQWFPGVFRK